MPPVASRLTRSDRNFRLPKCWSKTLIFILYQPFFFWVITARSTLCLLDWDWLHLLACPIPYLDIIPSLYEYSYIVSPDAEPRTCLSGLALHSSAPPAPPPPKISETREKVVSSKSRPGSPLAFWAPARPALIHPTSTLHLHYTVLSLCDLHPRSEIHSPCSSPRSSSLRYQQLAL